MFKRYLNHLSKTKIYYIRLLNIIGILIFVSLIIGFPKNLPSTWSLSNGFEKQYVGKTELVFQDGVRLRDVSIYDICRFTIKGRSNDCDYVAYETTTTPEAGVIDVYSINTISQSIYNGNEENRLYRYYYKLPDGKFLYVNNPIIDGEYDPPFADIIIGE